MEDSIWQGTEMVSKNWKQSLNSRRVGVLVLYHKELNSDNNHMSLSGSPCSRGDHSPSGTLVSFFDTASRECG